MADYVQITVTENIFLDPGNPNRIFKWTNDPVFSYDGKPGSKDVYSRDPDSCDFNPERYNRHLTVLHEHGKALDVPLAPPASRKLRDRWALMSLRLRRQIIRSQSGTWREWVPTS
jgi:hypothetical protein